jgi:hypothetical protein
MLAFCSVCLSTEHNYMLSFFDMAQHKRECCPQQVCTVSCHWLACLSAISWTFLPSGNWTSPFSLSASKSQNPCERTCMHDVFSLILATRLLVLTLCRHNSEADLVPCEGSTCTTTLPRLWVLLTSCDSKCPALIVCGNISDRFIASVLRYPDHGELLLDARPTLRRPDERSTSARLSPSTSHGNG